MEPGGHELYIFRYILNPLFDNGLPGNSVLHELYFNNMKPKFGSDDQALAHLWFGLTTIGTVHLSSLDKLFKSDTSLKITKGEILYRKMLVDVGRKLALDVEKSKKFIHVVILSKKLGGCPSTSKFMPPLEKQENPNAFLPYILKLFEVANDQCVIDPTDLGLLEEWLNKCNFIKITRDIVKKFNPNDTISKHCEL